MKKVIAAALTFVMISGTGITAYGAGYSDIKSTNWAYEAVNTMSDKAVIKGYPDGSFKPSNTVTYGEFIKMALIAATGEDAGNAESGNWATKYYNKALELGYYTKADITKDDLNEKITRAHMALVISAILGDVKIENYDEIQKGITDITYKTEYEYDITKSYAKGILTGYTDDTFRPDKTLSRAESATVIYRLVDESKRVLPTTDTRDSGSSTGEAIKPIDEVITNIDSFLNPGDGTINEDLAITEAYDFVRDGTKYGFELKENQGTKWIAIPESSVRKLGQIYLMKDGRIVEFTRLHPKTDGTAVAGYDSDITQMDYIVSLDTVDYIAYLIINPFKK